MFHRSARVFLITAALALSACGAPPGAAALARQQSALLQVPPPDDQTLRQTLRDQPAAWEELAMLLRHRVLLGTPVDEEFVDLVDQTAALTRRQNDLMDQDADDPALNRQVLDQLLFLWQYAHHYLRP